MSEAITTAYSEIEDEEIFYKKNKLYSWKQLTFLTMVILPRSCHDLAMILP